MLLENGFQTILDGSNADDLSDFRPWPQGCKGTRGPQPPSWKLVLQKPRSEIWQKNMDLPNWDKPSSACLASRIPYGTKITSDQLSND